MPIFPPDQDKMQADQARRLRHAIREEPPLANVEAATAAHDDNVLLFRGRHYRVPPVPCRRGLELKALRQAYVQVIASDAPGVAELERLRALTVEMLGIMGTLIRWRWWQVRNPLDDASAEEFQMLVDFFCSARTKSRVRAWASIRAAPWCRTTWPPSFPALRLGMRAGWPEASPAATGTTASGSTA